MAITIGNNNPTTSTVNSISTVFIGDGTSTQIVFDLKKAPFNLVFNDNPPLILGRSISGSSSATISGTIITVTFTTAIANSVALDASIFFTYNGII